MAGIVVSPAEIDQFDVVIATACALQSERRVEDGLLADISGKMPMMPGYFYRADLCLVISLASELLARCALAMQTPEQKRSFGRQPGGRLFFHAGGVL
jgi:hypothetical protein